MKRYVIAFLVFGVLSCGKKENKVVATRQDVTFKIEKVLVVNDEDICMTYFKLRIKNATGNRLLFSDNVIADLTLADSLKNNGFFLEKQGVQIKRLGSNDYGFMAVAPSSNNVFFLGARRLPLSRNIKDSTLFRKTLGYYTIRYDGSDFEFDSLRNQNL